MQLLLAFVLALSITAAAIPLLARWAPLVGLTDTPNPRKVHAIPVPRVGGIGMALGSLLPLLFLASGDARSQGYIAGLTVLLVFGIWDDRRELGYRAKFAGQLLAVLLLVVIGDLRIESITLAGRIALPDLLSWPLTVLFLIGVTNAVNLSDGLDGLAGGIALLCCAALAMLGAAVGNQFVTAVALVQCGALVGFLRFNTHPASVFMGDCGSQMLGYTMGALAIVATQGEGTAYSAALPLLLIGVPIFDTLGVMWGRIRAGRSPFAPDRSHFHHRLLVLGFTHGEAVALICCVQGLLFVVAYLLRFASDTVILAVFISAGVIALGATRVATERGWRLRAPQGRSGLIVNLFDLLRRSFPAPARPGRLLWAAAVSAAGYAVLALAASPVVEADLGWLSAGLLGLLGLIRLFAPGLMAISERLAAYIVAVVLVYLCETQLGSDGPDYVLSWILSGAAAAATMLRHVTGPRERLTLSTLDLLVLFLALVVPSLPGGLDMPRGLVLGLARAVLLLYSVEMLFGETPQRRLARIALLLCLGATVLRAAAGAL